MSVQQGTYTQMKRLHKSKGITQCKAGDTYLEYHNLPGTRGDDVCWYLQTSGRQGVAWVVQLEMGRGG